jgi:hypothetical protein
LDDLRNSSLCCSRRRWHHIVLIVRYRGAAFVVAGLIALAALGATLAAVESAGRPRPPSPTATARALCHDILGARALNSEPEKLITVRQFTYGPGSRPAPNAFPGLDTSQVVGVCWTAKPSTGYELYAVASGYKPVRIEGVTGVGFTSTPLPGFVDIP